MRQSRFSDGEHSRENAVVGGPRVIRDEATGDITTIVERRADTVAGARAPACLIFSTDRGFIRLWDYPAAWTDLPDAELLLLPERLCRSQSA